MGIVEDKAIPLAPSDPVKWPRTNLLFSTGPDGNLSKTSEKSKQKTGKKKKTQIFPTVFTMLVLISKDAYLPSLPWFLYKLDT